MNYYDCPKCNVRTASSRGCGCCGRRALPSELEAQRRRSEEFEMIRRAVPYEGTTLLGALTHTAVMNPTPENLAAVNTYEAELREQARRRERSSASMSAKIRAAVERVLPAPDYMWDVDDRGHEYRRKLR